MLRIKQGTQQHYMLCSCCYYYLKCTFLSNQRFGRNQGKQKSGWVAILVSPFYPTCIYLYHGVDSSTDNWQKMQIRPDSKFCTYIKAHFNNEFCCKHLQMSKLRLARIICNIGKLQLKTLQSLYKHWIQHLNWSLGCDAREEDIKPRAAWPWRVGLHEGMIHPRPCSLSSDSFQRWKGMVKCSLGQCCSQNSDSKIKGCDWVSLTNKVQYPWLAFKAFPRDALMCLGFTWNHNSLHPTVISLGALLFCSARSVLLLGPSPPVKVVSSFQLMSPLSTWSPPQGVWDPSQGLYSLWRHMLHCFVISCFSSSLCPR